MITRPEQTKSAAAAVQTWPRTRADMATTVEAYAERLVRYAFRRVGNVADAQDVVQEVFVRAFVAQPERIGIGTIGGYLFRSVANGCTDLLRKRRSLAGLHERVSRDQVSAIADGPIGVLQAAEELTRIQRLLERLPEEQAEVVRLRVLDGLKLAEIALLLECPEATVSSRLRYGLQKLRCVCRTAGVVP